MRNESCAQAYFDGSDKVGNPSPPRSKMENGGSIDERKFVRHRKRRFDERRRTRNCPVCERGAPCSTWKKKGVVLRGVVIGFPYNPEYVVLRGD